MYIDNSTNGNYVMGEFQGISKDLGCAMVVFRRGSKGLPKMIFYPPF